MNEGLALVLDWARADGHFREDPIVAEAVELGGYIARLAADDHQDIRVFSVRTALLIDTARRVQHRHLREAALDVHGGDHRFWRQHALTHVPFEELQRRRGLELHDGQWRAVAG